MASSQLVETFPVLKSLLRDFFRVRCYNSLQSKLNFMPNLEKSGVLIKNYAAVFFKIVDYTINALNKIGLE